MITEQIFTYTPNIAGPGRLLGLDVGQARIGVALSDAGKMIASPHSVYTRKSFAKDTKAIWDLVDEHQIQGLVVGWPLQPNGQPGSSCELVETFLKKLFKEREIPVLLQDERMSTAAVTRSLKESGMSRKKRQAVDDKSAASYILQGVLDRL